LHLELHLEFEHHGDFTCIEVQLENLVNFGKNQRVTLIGGFDFEVKLHGNLLESRNVFKDGSVQEFELIFFQWVIAGFSFVNEELIDFLFVHNQILPADNCQILLILACLDSNNLVRFSCLCLEESNGNLSQLLESE
jgi:hypothetical protein